MNILHIYKDYYPVLGGIENHVRLLAESQAAQGHAVTVLATNTGIRSTEETLSGVHIARVGRLVNVQSAPLSAALPSAVRRLSAGADIVHVHAPYPPGEAANLWFGRGHRTVITWHSDIVRQKTLLRVYAPTLRRVLQHADRILPTSEAYARTSPWLKPHLDKCTPVPLGVDTTRFTPAAILGPRAAELRAQFLFNAPVTPQATILLSVGRLRYYKGLDDLIRAMPDLPDTVAVIAGSGPMGDKWRALARLLHVADRIAFVGDVSDADLPSYYQAADIYVLPACARAEAFGIAVAEAMACGLPVVCTEVGTATSWVNQHNITGLVVPSRKPDLLVEAIRQLQSNLLTRRLMGNAARQRVLDEFTLDRMVQRVMEVYGEVMASPLNG